MPLIPTLPHILFVDDEAPIRELLAVFFRKKGLQVTTAINGEQARQLSRQADYDLIILDLHLAEEDGLDLLAYFKDSCPDRPVVIFTGMGLSQDLMERVRAGGADAFLSKTEPLGVLLDQVQQILVHGVGGAAKRPAPAPPQGR
jgi:DNA-binding response OmpR family regulator